MTNVSEQNIFSANVQRYDTTDPVLGGLTGESSLPVVDLTNRTRYLYNYINGFADVVNVTGNATIDASFLRKLIYINVTANTALTLTKTTNLLNGQRFYFIVKTTGVRSVQFVPDTSGTPDVIINLPAPFTGLWLHDGEEIALVKLADNVWWLEDINTNLKQVGNDALVRRQPKNTAVASGTSGILRADYARLWNVVSAAAVAEATWFVDNVTNKGFFTTGNTTTTFRWPDMRSMMWRGLDLGRGISSNRAGSTPGAYEAHQMGEYTDTQGANGVTDTVDTYASGPFRFKTKIINPGKEVITKNIGLTPVIYY